MAVKRPNEKNTKAQILAAFDELWKEKKALESHMNQSAKAGQAESTQNGNGKSSVAHPVNALAHKQQMSSILDGLNKLQFNFGGAVSDLSEKLLLEAFNLQELRTAVATEVQQLETLHSLQITDGSLEGLVEEYKESSKAFNEELSQRRETVDLEISQAQKAWAKDQEEHRRFVKERNDLLNKTRQRDLKEYTYDLTLQRKLDNTDHEQTSKSLYKELGERQQEQEKQWAEREKTIAEQEKVFEEHRAKVEAFPKELEAAIKRAKEDGKGIGYHQAKVKADLLAKETEGQRRAYELRIAALQETIQIQDARLQTLSKQMDFALKQAQDLAIKAIEGASNANSFQAIREIAVEQAKGQAKAK